MNPDDFESNTQLQSTSVDRDSDNQSSGGEDIGNQLAENIAHCVVSLFLHNNPSRIHLYYLSG